MGSRASVGLQQQSDGCEGCLNTVPLALAPIPRRSRVGYFPLRGKTTSHRRADLPGLELVVADAKLLALGLLARGGTQDQVEDPLAALLNGLLTIDHAAAIDVHVVGHAAPERGV